MLVETEVAKTVRKRRVRKWPFVLGILLILGAVAFFQVSQRLGPGLRQRVVEEIRQRYQADVELKSLDLHLLPQIRIVGKGLTLRVPGQPDGPPLISVGQFTIETGLKDVMSGPRHVRRLWLKELRITVQRGKARQRVSSGRRGGAPTFVIDEVNADGTVLEVIPKQAGKEPLLFELYKLKLHSAGLGQPMTFRATMNNARPPGLVETEGKFGPWNSESPIETLVSGNYTFRNANLGVFKGISGTLASDGKYNGVLERIETEGTTDVPNFTVRTSGKPVHLRTTFHTIVDGGDGDTLLQPVDARFLRSRIIARGGATGIKGIPGKDISLYLTMNGDRLEDLLRLAIKSDKPVMTGIVNLKTKFHLPPGNADVIDKLALDGQFQVADAKFMNAGVQGKIEELSRRALGQKKGYQPEEEVVSDLRGKFTLKNSVMAFSQLSFGVPGALIQLAGTYDLSSETMDFHGKMRMQATLSQTMSGYKSLFLKVVDPFFKKDGAGAVLPIKITGTRQQPTFGLELRRKKE